jgi:hypothetical protein
MNSITTLSGTDTFETWFNRTNTIISELNKANPTLISVRDFGATGDGVTDDTLGISAAFMALNGLTNGVLYFPRGNYRLNSKIARLNRQLEFTLKRPFYIVGDGAKITSGITSEYMIFLNNKGFDVNIKGIEFDANQKALGCFKINDDDGSTGIIEIDRCAFTNSFQGGDLGIGLGGGGLFISGSKYVNLTNCIIRNHTRAIGTGTPTTAGTVGVAIQPSGNGYPKNVNVSGCYFENITNSETGFVVNNVDCDCLSVFTSNPDPGAGGITYSDATATISNNHFRNCKGRSIKIQNDRTIVTNNTFYKNIQPIDISAEVNLQIAIGTVSNNTFYYAQTDAGLSPFTADGQPVNQQVRYSHVISFYSGVNRRTRSYTVTDNQVINMVPKSVGVLNNFFTAARSITAASAPLMMTVSGNKIVGPCKFFGNITTHSTTTGQEDTKPVYYSFVGNMIEQLTDTFTPGRTFGFLWSSENVGATLTNISIINNVNAIGGTTAAVLLSSSAFRGASSTLTGLACNLHKINNTKIDQ